jgi:hypothetical protein
MFLWSRVSQGAYHAFPDAKFSLFFFIECDNKQSALALAYVLWHITDSSYDATGSNPILLACSYMFLPGGIFGFSLYDDGLAPHFEALRQDCRASPDAPFWFPIITTWNLNNTVVNDALIQQCISNAA